MGHRIRGRFSFLASLTVALMVPAWRERGRLHRPGGPRAPAATADRRRRTPRPRPGCCSRSPPGQQELARQPSGSWPATPNARSPTTRRNIPAVARRDPLHHQQRSAVRVPGAGQNVAGPASQIIAKMGGPSLATDQRLKAGGQTAFTDDAPVNGEPAPPGASRPTRSCRRSAPRSVMQFMISRGREAGARQWPQGFGEESPVAPNNTPQGARPQSPCRDHRGGDLTMPPIASASWSPPFAGHRRPGRCRSSPRSRPAADLPGPPTLAPARVVGRTALQGSPPRYRSRDYLAKFPDRLRLRHHPRPHGTEMLRVRVNEVAANRKPGPRSARTKAFGEGRREGRERHRGFRQDPWSTTPAKAVTKRRHRHRLAVRPRRQPRSSRGADYAKDTAADEAAAGKSKAGSGGRQHVVSATIRWATTRPSATGRSSCRSDPYSSKFRCSRKKLTAAAARPTFLGDFSVGLAGGRRGRHGVPTRSTSTNATPRHGVGQVAGRPPTSPTRPSSARLGISGRPVRDFFSAHPGLHPDPGDRPGSGARRVAQTWRGRPEVVRGHAAASSPKPRRAFVVNRAAAARHLQQGPATRSSRLRMSGRHSGSVSTPGGPAWVVAGGRSTILPWTQARGRFRRTQGKAGRQGKDSFVGRSGKARPRPSSSRRGAGASSPPPALRQLLTAAGCPRITVASRNRVRATRHRHRPGAIRCGQRAITGAFDRVDRIGRQDAARSIAAAGRELQSGAGTPSGASGRPRSARIEGPPPAQKPVPARRSFGGSSPATSISGSLRHDRLEIRAEARPR